MKRYLQLGHFFLVEKIGNGDFKAESYNLFLRLRFLMRVI